ncbi:MAG: hypothetical protein IPI67_04920 [Myxococcales bacterium]|nr:hypothetical protein [Myxococcales bacterium]
MRSASFAPALCLLIATLATLACSGKTDDAATGGAGGSGAAGGSGGAGGACDQADVACPADKPFPGSSCAVTEACKYPVGDGMNTWTYSCPAGFWIADATCEGAIGGGCPVPPLVETCSDPFKGKASQTEVELGIADPTQPFEPLKDGAELAMIWGGQGSPMVSFRVRVAGLDASCVRLDTTLSIGGKPAASTPSAVTMHCGESLGVFSIFPMEQVSCEPPYTNSVVLDINVAVDGVGSVKKTVKVENPACMLPG